MSVFGRQAILFLGLLGTAFAQTSIQCDAQVPQPLAASASGTSELVGDYYLTCSGGTGSVTTTLTLFLNTDLATGDVPVLSIDNGAGGMYQGVPGAANTVVFSGVTITAPGASGARSLHFSNVRADAATLGVSSTNVPTTITEYLSSTGSSSLPINNPEQTAAFVLAPNSVVCTASSPNPLTVAANGTAELVGNYLLTCSLGTGQITTDISLTFNTSLATSGTPSLVVTGGATYSGSIGPGVNVLTFHGVNFAGPGSGSPQTLQVSNVRVNASQLGASPTGPTLIQAYALASNSAVSVNSPAQTVASIPTSTLGIPSVTSLTPAAGSGPSQTFVAQFGHGSGFSNLTVLNILMNNMLDGRHGCYIAYIPQSNTLYLVDDGGDAGGPYANMTLNGTGSVSNSQCTVFGSGSSGVGNGTGFTLTLNMSFNTAFGGNKVMYLAAGDSSARNTGWQIMGTFGVTPLPAVFPNPVSMSPASGSAFNAMISVAYQDAASASNLQTVWALINTGLDGRAACYVAYYRPGNQLYLVPDNGDGSQAQAMSLTGTGSLSNSQCTITAQGSSALLSGSTLTLNLNVTFNHSFTGPKGVWMAASTLGGQVSSWQALGTWQVP